MAMTGRKESTPSSSSTTQPRDTIKPRSVPVGGGDDNSRTGRIQRNIGNVIAELRKVSWPTRDETRNLTIVVIGISAAVGALLATLDVIFSAIYNAIAGITF